MMSHSVISYVFGDLHMQTCLYCIVTVSLVSVHASQTSKLWAYFVLFLRHDLFRSRSHVKTAPLLMGPFCSVFKIWSFLFSKPPHPQKKIKIKKTSIIAEINMFNINTDTLCVLCFWFRQNDLSIKSMFLEFKFVL